MAGSRTIKTLSALVGAMTVGAVLLMALETDPIRPRPETLITLAAHRSPVGELSIEPQVPIQPVKWRHAIVHAAEWPDSRLARGCHFIIAADGSVKPTRLWQEQRDGRHISIAGRDFNADSIGICLIGDFSSRRPSSEQFRSLVRLMRKIQQACSIPADHVYLRSDLDARSRLPGKAFPAQPFAEYLLRSIRLQ